MLGKTLLWILKEGRTGADDWEELHIEPPTKTNGRLFWSSGIYESCGSQKSSGIWAAKRWQCQCSLVASTSTLSSRWRTIIIIRSSIWQNGNEYQWLHSVHLRVSGSTLLYKLSNSSWSLPYLTFLCQIHPLSFVNAVFAIFVLWHCCVSWCHSSARSNHLLGENFILGLVNFFSLQFLGDFQLSSLSF